MDKLSFYKMEAAGNDFILLDLRRSRSRRIKGMKYAEFCSKYCSRKKGIGADGLLLIKKSKKSAFKMRIFNSDGSEAEMCGNGARCASLWFFLSHAENIKNREALPTLKLGSLAKRGRKAGMEDEKFTFETKAGSISAFIPKSRRVLDKNNSKIIKVKLTDPFDLKENMEVKVLGRTLRVNFINTGVPHVVVFVEGLEKIDVRRIGRILRFHKKFQPAGANVNFVEIKGKDEIRIRTYERGVEDETFACGTGAVASSILANYKLGAKGKKIKMKVVTSEGEELIIYSDSFEDRVRNVWSQGRVRLVYKGSIV
ncbi:MAG: diaminopimelate epimerase [Candidatus Omnitrophica bacterium]|nr:diaminopimelate epimerase [Candidatus Omnitrophota bacterium]MBD3268570.1 diaminopimelate epimerase [Candidatus Omnitrophota bacterium]